MKTICLDFDGVCNTYTGWKGEDFLYSPRVGLEDFLIALNQLGYQIAIFSTRQKETLRIWFELEFSESPVHKLLQNGNISFPDKKPPAIAYIDDRGIQFNGDFKKTLEEIQNFKAFWEN